MLLVVEGRNPRNIFVDLIGLCGVLLARKDALAQKIDNPTSVLEALHSFTKWIYA